VLVGLVRSRGSRTAVLVNASRDSVAVEPLLEDDVQLVAAPGALTLAPADVAVLPLRGGRADDRAAGQLAGAAAERGDVQR
jgi:hypothetical protein